MGFLTSLFGPPSQEKFAAIIMRELKRQGEGRALSYDPSAFSLSPASGEEADVMFLGNAYTRYCAAPRDERDLVVQQFVAAMLERRNVKEPESFEEAKPLLLPTVRSLTFFSCSALQIRLQSMNDVRGGLAPSAEMPCDIGVGLVLDYPSSVRYLPPDRFETWHVSFEDALEVAKDNLRKKSLDRFEQVQPGVWVSPWGDTYDAARLLLPELFTRLDVNGDPVALAPHRDLVVVTGSEDRAGLAAMASIATEALGEPYPVSPRPLVLRGFAWSEFTIDDAELAPLYRQLALQGRAGDYADQCNLLNAIYEEANEDIFVAQFFATRHKDSGALSSFCSWSNAGVQLLPEADRVSFVNVGPDGNALRTEIVPWERVRIVLGARMEKIPAMHPPRWRVEGFPSDEELGRLLAE